ncbi:unnamed protein product [Scytosiphon promiscuus]
MAATALLDCVKQRPLSRASDAPSADGGGGGRVDSGVWPMIHLLDTGGEPDFHQEVQACGRKESSGAPDGVDLLLRSASAGSLGGDSLRRMEEQQMIEADLERTMPKEPPFSRFRPGGGGGSGSWSRSSSTRSASKKAIFLADRDGLGSEKLWHTGDSTSLSRFFAANFKSSSSSSSGSGGGGPGVLRGENPQSGGGGGSIKNDGSGGGGASWEDGLGPLPAAGGASRMHDDVDLVNLNRAANLGHAFRQPSFVADREIGDLPLPKDACVHHVPSYNKPRAPSAGYLHTSLRGLSAAGTGFDPSGGSLRETPAGAGLGTWGTTASVAVLAATRPASDLSVPSSGVYDRGGTGTCVGNVRASAGPPRMHPDGQSPSGLGYSDHSSRVATAPGGPIAPPPIPRAATVAVSGTPAPAHRHEKKPSYNLLAMMIPDITKFGGGPSSTPALQTSTTWPGATGFAAHGVSPVVTADGNPVQAGRGWTRQAALARYHYKRKRRPFVKAMRENDPKRKEQNIARERPRDSGKFKKKHQDFISIIKVQRAAGSRSVSGESLPPARDSTTPPPTGQKRRRVGGGVGGDAGRSGEGSGEGSSDGDDGDSSGGGDDGRGGRPLRSRRSQATDVADGSGGGGDMEQGSPLETRTPAPSVAVKLGSKRDRAT